MMPLEYSMLIIALVFVFIGLAIVMTLRSLMIRMTVLMRKTSELQREIMQVSLECRTLMHSADITVKEIGETFSIINSVTGAAKSVGQSVEQTATTLKKVSGIVNERATQYVQQNASGDTMQWAEIIMSAWQLWRNQRQKFKEAERSE